MGKLILLFLLLGQVLVLSRTSAVDYFHRNTQDYNFFTQSTSTLNENRARSFTFTDIGKWQPSPEVLNGQSKIQVNSWRGSRREYQLTVQNQSTIVEPTMNFLGWQTTANGQRVTYLNSDQIGGRIAYQLPAGEYHVSSEFTQWTWPRIIGNSVSILTALGLIMWIAVGKYISKNEN